MANVDKPTGVAFVPRHIARAKEIKEKINACEVMGMIAKNNSSKDSNDFLVDREAALKGSQLLDKDSNLCPPKTKEKKTNDTASTILQLADKQKQNTEATSVAQATMVATMAKTLSDNFNELWTEVAGMATKLERFRSKLEGLIMQKLLE